MIITVKDVSGNTIWDARAHDNAHVRKFYLTWPIICIAAIHIGMVAM